MRNYRKTVLKNTEANYASFKETELAKSKSEIFDDAYQIYFMGNVRDYLAYTELDTDTYKILAREKDKVLDDLYRHYLREDFEKALSTDDDISDFIRQYCVNIQAEIDDAEM